MVPQRHRSFQRWIRKRFPNGLWFPLLEQAIDFAYSKLSPSEWFIRSFNLAGSRSPAAPELYQVLVVGIGAVWLSTIQQPSPSLFTSVGARAIGISLTVVVIADLFVFVLHWIFVDKKELESTSRSLATFGVSLIEISIAFAIIFSLGGCATQSRGWSIFYENLRSILKLRPAPVVDSPGCEIASHFQLIIGGLILAVAIASLIGAIVRPKKRENSV